MRKPLWTNSDDSPQTTKLWSQKPRCRLKKKKKSLCIALYQWSANSADSHDSHDNASSWPLCAQCSFLLPYDQGFMLIAIGVEELGMIGSGRKCDGGQCVECGSVVCLEWEKRGWLDKRSRDYLTSHLSYRKCRQKASQYRFPCFLLDRTAELELPP